MKKLAKLATVALFPLATAGVANAGVGLNDLTIGSPYVGIKAGVMDFDGFGSTNANFGLYGGVEITGGMGIEASFERASIKDAVTAESANAIVRSQDGDVKHAGVKAFYKHQFNGTPVYVKGSLGYGWGEHKTNIFGQNKHNPSLTETENVKADFKSVTYGLAGGYKLSDSLAVELEYEHKASDLQSFNAGIRYKF